MQNISQYSNGFSLEILQGRARLVFDAPDSKVNLLTEEILAAFDRTLDSLNDSSNISILILESGKKDSFIAGVDVHDIQDINTPSEALDKAKKGQAVLDKLAALPFPTLAVIQGACMGGGTEMSLACDYRIAVDNPQTVIGLPEVKLGIFPGMGGTQRLPRLVGLTASLPLILSGEPVDARRALAMGLVDACLPEKDGGKAAVEFTAKILSGMGAKIRRQRRRKRPFFSRLLESNPVTRALIFKAARKTVLKRTGGHFPAPLAAIRLIQKSIGTSLKKGLRMEREAFSSMAVSPVSKNLIHVFFGIRRIRKMPDFPDVPEPRDIHSAAVCGTGIMGPAIAWLFSAADIPVHLKGRSLDSAARSLGFVQKLYDRGVRKRLISPENARKKMAFVSASDSPKDLAGRDFAIEAVAEDRILKEQFLSQMEQALPQDAVIATCTSSFKVEDLGKALYFPERFIGVHFLYPADRSPLVEVIPGNRTDKDVVASTVNLLRRLKKTPLIVQDCPGFLINRILCIYLLEAASLWQEGYTYRFIDETMELFGMAAGPFSLLDRVGVDTAFKAAGILEENYNWGFALPEEVLETMSKHHWLGRKSGAGFYIRKGKKQISNPGLKNVSGPDKQKKTERDGEKIRERLICAMTAEAVRCLEDGVVSTPLHVDMALVLGTGFPAFRGGLLRHVDSLGLALILDRMQEYSRRLGPRFGPPGLLARMAKNSENFYP